MNTNKIRIEESAKTALIAALLRCPILAPFISSNDKTPSWDGAVFVYNNGDQKKDDLRGRVPVQVKGTTKVTDSRTPTLSCAVSDLKNYYNDGGCIYFLVSVVLKTGESQIFFADLQVYDLHRLLSDVGKRKTVTINFHSFPTNDTKKMANIFLNFLENSRKQVIAIGKDILSLEQLRENGVVIESLTISTYGAGSDQCSFVDFITSQNHYLYAKPKGLNIEIPVGKINNMTISRSVAGSVMVRNIEHYSTYSVIHEKGNTVFRIGKGIRIVLSESKHKVDINFVPTCTLNDSIKDANFFVDVLENREITLNGATLQFRSVESCDLVKCKQNFAYYADVKRMLDILGVTDELQIDSLSPNDEKNIRNFVNATLYNKKIGFPTIDAAAAYGAFTIANLSIWIWATRQDDGFFQLDSFFSSRQIAVFKEEDVTLENPVPATQYLLLDEGAFKDASNMDFDAIQGDILAMEHHPVLLGKVTHLLLNVLRGYDARDQKDTRLLELAEEICLWLARDEGTEHQILKLNQLQVIRRKRPLSVSEIVDLTKLADASNYPSIRCGAYLLLGDVDAAQECFNDMKIGDQEEFLTYPICHFGYLKKTEKESESEQQ